jgi:FtsZ-binding cell division protein ZapB
MSVVDTVQLLELRTKKAAGLIAMLRKEKAELQEKFDLVNTHNAELEEYAESFTTSNKLIEESIAKAMENLSTIDGLDDIPLMDDAALELEAAEGFSSGDALAMEEDIDLDSLLGDTPAL